jgi:peptidoglycan hydrolase-like protein with peptidoglycan-binding domain
MALQHGVASDEVTQLQRQLAQMGFQCPSTGSYDDATYYAVAQFQGAAGLNQSGQADDDTLAAIQEKVEAGFGSEDYGQVDYESPGPEEAEPPEIA